MNTDVRRIQSALDRQSFKVNITGVWDAATCQALMAFQSAKYGTVKRSYLDTETFMDLGIDARTADRLEASYGHVCGGVGVPPSTYGNTVGKSMAPEVKRIQRALGVRETGKLDERTCQTLSSLARNSGQSALITRPVLERLGFASTEAAALVQKFAFATCNLQATARGRAVIAGVGLAYPGFSGFAGEFADDEPQSIEGEVSYADFEDDSTDPYGYEQTKDTSQAEAYWTALLPAGKAWSNIDPNTQYSLRKADTGDYWEPMDQQRRTYRQRYVDNQGTTFYLYKDTMYNEHRWAVPTDQRPSSRKKELVKLLQQELKRQGYSIGAAGADGVAGKDTCTAAFSASKDLGICGEVLLQTKLFRALNFSEKEVNDAWKEINGVCQSYYVPNAYGCLPAPVTPATPPPTPVTPTKPPVTPPAAKDCDPGLPSGMVWCSGQPAGATRVSGPSPVANCSGWTKETWRTSDDAVHVHFIQSAKKLSKWACAIKKTPVPPPPPEPVNKAGWGWLVGGLLVAAAAGTFYFSKPAGSSRGRRR